MRIHPGPAHGIRDGHGIRDLVSVLLLATALPTALFACSGPPPPKIVILPSKIEYSYVDPADGTTRNGAIDIVDELGNPQPGVDYQFCDGAASPPQLNCFDSSLMMARLEVPAGATVYFQAYYDKNAGAARSGSVFGTSGNPHFLAIRNLLGDIQSSQAGNRTGRMRVSELMSRGTGGAIDPGGGLRPALVVDWSGVKPLPDGSFPAVPSGFSMTLGGNTQLPQPTGWTGSFDASKQRWYTRSGTSNDAYQVARTVNQHMGARLPEAPEVWFALDVSGQDIKGLHVWASITGAASGDTNNQWIELDATAGTGTVQSEWRWDMQPQALGGRNDYGGLIHLPVNGQNASGVGYSAGSEYDTGADAAITAACPGDRQFECSFRRRHQFDIPSEPGGYVTQVGVSFLWKYGSEVSGGGAPFGWDLTVGHIGYVDLAALAIKTTDTAAPKNGAQLVQRVDTVRGALGCLVGTNPPDSGCTWAPAPPANDPVWSNLRNQLIGAATSGDPTTGIKNVLIGWVKNALGATTDPPFVTTGTQTTLNYQYSGKFPQSTGNAPPGGGGGSGGQPGYGYIVVRDGSAPRNFQFLKPGDRLWSVGGGNGSHYTDPVIEGAETGQRLGEAMRKAGKPTKMLVAVFDENPGLVAFGPAQNPPAPVYLESGGDISGQLAPYAALAGNGTPPSIQIWYTAEKAGYTPKASGHPDLLTGAFVERVFGDDPGVPAVVTGRRVTFLGDDSRMEPQPTFRFYPFRYPEGSSDGNPGVVVNYLPKAYVLLQQAQGGTQEPFASAAIYEIDLDHAQEPMGLDFAEGSKEGADPQVHPKYDQNTLKLFVRASDGRIRGGTSAQLVPYPNPSPFYGAGNAPFERPNSAPFWYDPGDGRGEPQAPDHRPNPDGTSPSGYYGVNLFPDRKVPRNVAKQLPGAADILTPPPMSNTAMETAIQAKAASVGFADRDIFGRAAGIAVKDTIPPTVILAVTDTKYDRTAFFGNPFVGGMSQASVQELLKAASFDTDSSGLPIGPLSNPDQASVDPKLTPLDEGSKLSQVPPPVLFPYTAYPYAYTAGTPYDESTAAFPSAQGLQHALRYCSEVPNPLEGGCLADPIPAGSREFRFDFDLHGDGADYERQLAQIAEGTFHPMKFFAATGVTPGDANDPAQTGSVPHGPGLWVDEDSRLVFRVIAWDNLNSYLPAVTTVSGQEGFTLYGADSPEIDASTSREFSVDVTINDPGSGNGQLVLSRGDLNAHWPSYIFRNPNRIDQGGTLTDTGDDAYVEVKFTDGARNTTFLRIKLYVVENSMRILSLKEDKFRSFNE